MAIALIAEYGDCCPGAISLIGSSCSARRPAASSHDVTAAISPMSPMPQLAAVGHENSGMRRPARRRPVRSLSDSLTDSGAAIEVPKDARDTISEDGRRRDETHHEKRLARKIKKVSRLHDDTIAEQTHDEIFFRFERRHL